MAKFNHNIKIILPASNHKFEEDYRLLIPYLQGSLIGFMNKDKQIVIPAKYEIVLDDFEWLNPLIRVGRYVPIATKRESGDVSTYIHKRYGLMDKEGNMILPMEYEGIANPCFAIEYSYTVRSLQKGYAVFDRHGKIIVPFGRYDYIDGYDYGYARVKIGSPGSIHHEGDKWGIINESGEIVLTPEYERIDRFYQKTNKYCLVEKDGCIQEFHIEDGQLRYEGAFEDEIRRQQQEEENYRLLQEYRESQTDYIDRDMMDSWDAMTDGMYGDMPDGFDGDYDFLGR